MANWVNVSNNDKNNNNKKGWVTIGTASLTKKEKQALAVKQAKATQLASTLATASALPTTLGTTTPNLTALQNTTAGKLATQVATTKANKTIAQNKVATPVVAIPTSSFSNYKGANTPTTYSTKNNTPNNAGKVDAQAIAKSVLQVIQNVTKAKNTAGGLVANTALDLIKLPGTLARYSANAIQGKENKPMALESTLSNMQKKVAVNTGYKKTLNLDKNAGGLMDMSNVLFTKPQQAIYSGVNALQTGQDVGKAVNQGLTGNTDLSGGHILRTAGMKDSGNKIGLDDVLGTVLDLTVGLPGLGEGSAFSKTSKLIKEGKKVEAIKLAREELVNAGKTEEVAKLDKAISKVDTSAVEKTTTPNIIIKETVPTTTNKAIETTSKEKSLETNINTPTKVETPLKLSKNVPTSEVKTTTNATTPNIPIKTTTEADNIIKQATEETKKRGLATTVIVDKQTPKEVKKVLKANGDVYVVQSDRKTLDIVQKNIDKLGYDKSLIGVQNKFVNGQRFTKEDTTTMELLYKHAVETGDYDKAVDIISDLAVLGTEQGQSIQALSMITKLSNAGRLKTIESKLNRINSLLTPNQEKKLNKLLGTNKIELPKELKTNVLKAKMGDELDSAVNDALIYISNHEPLTISDKIRSWRYLSMLGNPRTHIRNMLGNTAMKGVSTVKNKLSGAIEDVLNIFTKTERSKTFLRATKDQRKFAKEDALKNKGRIMGTNKYEMNTQKRAFENKKMNKLANLSSGALSSEDWLYSGSAYKNALASYMKANKYTSEFLKSGTKEANLALEKGRTLAIKEAEEQTFRQYSQLASNLSHFENQNVLTKVGMGATIPFKKTPINIAKTGYQYSPARFVQSIFDFKKIAQAIPEDKPQLILDAIDGLAKGLTGTSIAAVGFGLASTGAITGSGASNAKEYALQQKEGKQAYSINVFGKNYSLDWLSPAAIPLFFGVELYNSMYNKETLDPNKAISKVANTFEAMSKMMDPLTSMSMLQGINSSLQTYNAKGTPGGYVGALVMNGVENFAGQFIPTVVGQTARTIDTKRRDTTASGTGIDKALGSFVNKQIAKIPGLSTTLQPYTNIYGQEEKTGGVATRIFSNFISPGYLKDVNVSNTDKELTRLYKATGQSSVLPATASRYMTIDKKTVYLTPKEYTKWNKTDGKVVLNTINKMIKSDYYKSLPDTSDDSDTYTKEKAIKSVYAYAQKVAKEQYVKDQELKDELNNSIDKYETKLWNSFDIWK